MLQQPVQLVAAGAAEWPQLAGHCVVPAGVSLLDDFGVQRGGRA